MLGMLKGPRAMPWFSPGFTIERRSKKASIRQPEASQKATFSCKAQSEAYGVLVALTIDQKMRITTSRRARFEHQTCVRMYDVV